jgi:hypothetical protein
MIVPKDPKEAAVDLKPLNYESGSGAFDNKDSKLKTPNVPEQRYRQSISDSMIVLISRQPAASDKPRFEFSRVTLHRVWLPQGLIRFGSNRAQKYPWPEVQVW